MSTVKHLYTSAPHSNSHYTHTHTHAHSCSGHMYACSACEAQSRHMHIPSTYPLLAHSIQEYTYTFPVLILYLHTVFKSTHAHSQYLSFTCTQYSRVHIHIPSTYPLLAHSIQEYTCTFPVLILYLHTVFKSTHAHSQYLSFTCTQYSRVQTKGEILTSHCHNNSEKGNHRLFIFHMHLQHPSNHELVTDFQDILL